MKLFHASPKSRIETVYPLTHFGVRGAAMDRAKHYLREKRPTFLYECEAVFANPLRCADYGLDMSSGTRLADALYYDENVISSEEREAVIAVHALPPEVARQVLARVLLAKGYDSLVYANQFEGAGDSWVALDGANVKIVGVKRILPSDVGISWDGKAAWSRRYVCENCGNTGRASKDNRGPEIVCPVCDQTTCGRAIEEVLAA